MEEEKLQANTPTGDAGATQPVAQPAEPQETAAEATAAAGIPLPEDENTANAAAQETSAGASAQTPPEPKPESKMRRFLRRLFRWVLGILIVFGLGFVAASWLLYRPARQAAEKAQAAAEAASQQAEAAQGQLLEVQVKDLQQQLQQAQEAAQAAQLKEALAEAYANAYALRLALKDGDATGARLHAEALAKALDTLKNLVPSEHQGVVADLQKQVADVQVKLDSPTEADWQMHNIIHNLTTLKGLLDH